MRPESMTMRCIPSCTMGGEHLLAVTSKGLPDERHERLTRVERNFSTGLESERRAQRLGAVVL